MRSSLGDIEIIDDSSTMSTTNECLRMIMTQILITRMSEAKKIQARATLIYLFIYYKTLYTDMYKSFAVADVSLQSAQYGINSTHIALAKTITGMGGIHERL